MLARMDKAVHSELYTPRPAFSLLLSAFKLQLLTGSEHSTARIVCQASHSRDAHTSATHSTCMSLSAAAQPYLEGHAAELCVPREVHMWQGGRM